MPESARQEEGSRKAQRPLAANGVGRRSMAADLRGFLRGDRQPGTQWRHIIIGHVRRDFGLRAISILLAIVLWAFVNAGQRGALVTLRVPVGYRLLPAGMVILNQHPDFVEIEVRGPRTLLSLLDPDRLTLRLDLAGVGVGQAVFKIGPDMFNVPRQTDVTRVSPSQIVLDIDRIAQRQVPVYVDVGGKPAAGYHITSVSVKPSNVELEGPGRYLAQIKRVKSAPVEVAGIKDTIIQQVKLRSPRQRVTIKGAQTAEATINVSAIIENREFHKLPVDVRNTAHKVRVNPREVSVTVRGPINQLSNLKLSGAVYVSAEGIPPGEHKLPVQVTLPDGVQLVHASPNKVAVVIYQAHRANSR
jgi:YbbR-like protein